MKELTDPWKRVLALYELPPVLRIGCPGGTAAPKLLLETRQGSFMIRQRPDGLADPEFIQFDHAWRGYLAAQRFPVAPLVSALSGGTCTEVEGHVYELSHFVPGSLCTRPDPAQLRNAGRALARYHCLGREFSEPGKERFPREDHASVLRPLLENLFGLAGRDEEVSQLKALADELEEVSARLDSGLYETLEQGVIHGDFHAGNVLFRGSEVAAFLDLDYANREAIWRDIGDAFIGLAATHRDAYNPDDIWSLTQAWTVDRARALTFLEGYLEVHPLPPKPHSLALLMLSRWIQIRLRGARKVDDAHKIELVLRDFRAPVDFLKEQFTDFMDDLLNECAKPACN